MYTLHLQDETLDAYKCTENVFTLWACICVYPVYLKLGAMYLTIRDVTGTSSPVQSTIKVHNIHNLLLKGLFHYSALF